MLETVTSLASSKYHEKSMTLLKGGKLANKKDKHGNDKNDMGQLKVRALFVSN